MPRRTSIHRIERAGCYKNGRAGPRPCRPSGVRGRAPGSRPFARTVPRRAPTTGDAIDGHSRHAPARLIRASRIARTEVGAAASLRPTSGTGRRRCAPDGRRRPTRPPACLLTTATSGPAIGRGNRGSAAGRDHRNCAPQVLLAAISGRVIRGPRISTGGACQFGLRRDQLLIIAAAAAGYEPEARTFRRATRLPADDGRPDRRTREVDCRRIHAWKNASRSALTTSFIVDGNPCGAPL